MAYCCLTLLMCFLLQDHTMLCGHVSDYQYNDSLKILLFIVSMVIGLILLSGTGKRINGCGILS
uniref:FXYD domain-containing ion transport regulator n=1 Tax=Arundo donax TaxID=35708 RepID=A0A0A8Y0M0_ARUDO